MEDDILPPYSADRFIYVDSPYPYETNLIMELKREVAELKQQIQELKELHNIRLQPAKERYRKINI